MRTSRKRAFAILSLAVGTGIFACNIFIAPDQCASDSDCAGGATCDPAGHYCAPSTADVAVPDVVLDGGFDAPRDAPTEAEAAAPACDTLAPFGSFTLVAGFEGTPILTARLTSDEQNVIYSALNGCEQETCLDLFVAHRSGVGAPFGVGALLPSVNCDMAPEYWSTLSADGRLIFFESGRALVPTGGACGNDLSRIWSATRVSTSTDFGTPRIDSLFANDGGAVDSAPYLHPDGRTLYFVSLGRPGTGGQDLYVAAIDALGLVSTVSEVSVANTKAAENFPVITRDDRTLYFARNDAPREVWLTRRADPAGSFQAPQRVLDFDGTYDVIPAWISDDNCRFYFASNRVSPDGGMVTDYRLWVAERRPE